MRRQESERAGGTEGAEIPSIKGAMSNVKGIAWRVEGTEGLTGLTRSKRERRQRWLRGFRGPERGL